MDRLDLVAHCRDKVRSGAYDNGAVFWAALKNASERVSADGMTRSQLLAERERSVRQGDTAKVAVIDKALSTRAYL